MIKQTNIKPNLIKNNIDEKEELKYRTDNNLCIIYNNKKCVVQIKNVKTNFKVAYPRVSMDDIISKGTPQ